MFFFLKYYVIWYIEQHRYSMMICVTLCNYIQCSLKLPPWGGSWKLFDLRTTSVSWAMRRPGAPWRTTPCTNGCGSCSASWRGTAWCWTRRPMRHSPNWAYAAEICWDLRSLGSKLGEKVGIKPANEWICMDMYGYVWIFGFNWFASCLWLLDGL
jgi:hypothetical protein